MEKKNLFSQEALDKLRSPEKLDTLLHVTDSLSWMALISIMMMLTGVVIWSVMGSFTIKTEGMGMLMDSGGIISVSHISAGNILKLNVSPGDKVNAGDVIARLTNPSQKAEAQMAENSMVLAKNSTEASTRAAEYDSKQYQEMVNSVVTSFHDGVVEEVPVRAGDVVNAGETICTIRLTEKRGDLSGVIYVPVSESKKVKPGMTIQLNPSGVNVQSSGSLIGVVRSVSDYPVSTATIQRTLANDQLPQVINQTMKSAVAEVRFDLVKDDKDASGYLWTSVVGRHDKITPGAFVNGSIVIDRQPPIQKVFYKFSQWLRNR